MPGLDFKISRWTCEFVDAATERAFVADRWRRISQQLRVTHALCILAYGSALILNYVDLGAGPDLLWLGLGRGVVVLTLVWMFVAASKPMFTPALAWGTVAGEVLLGFCEALEFRLYAEAGALVDPLAVPFYAFAIVLFYAFLFNRFALTTAACLIGALVFTVASIYIPGGSLNSSLHITQYFLVGIVLGGATTRLLNRLLRREWMRGKELEVEVAERRRAEAEARQANQAKDRFLATMSHELRTPLQGILGMANLLQSNLDGRDLERARTIEGSGRVLLDLINNVFDVVRAKSDGESLSEDTFDLHGLLQETVLIMDLPGERPGRRLSLSIDPALPRWLHGDGDRIRRILYNLISNALKYGEGRPVSVTALRVGDGGGAGDCRVKIVVADQGPGIPAEDRQRIFEEFVRLHEGSTEQPGIGLGLSITSRLAKLLGGEVWVESEVGNGACFHFIVPLAAAAPREPTPATSPEAEGAPGLRVLLVEDLEINRQVAMGYLERAGHHVTPVETGGDAVAQAASGDFDVILMDIALPDISGIEATKAIRALPNGLRASVPIIALTANVFPDDQARYKAAGMNAILSKPLAPADLDNALAGATVEPEAEDRQPCLLDIEFLGNERAVLGDDVVSALVVEFRQQSEAILRELGDAARAKDMEAIGRLAHRLASLSGNFGLMDLLRHCQDTERVAGANDVQGATERVEALPAKFAAAIDALTAELSELQAAS